MERDAGATPPAESGEEPQDVNQLLGQFGDATESKGANVDDAADSLAGAPGSSAR